MAMAYFYPCGGCGAALQIPNFGYGTVQMRDVTHRCRCGYTNATPDGRYDFNGDAIVYLKAAGPGRVARFKVVAEAAAAGTVAPDQAVTEAAEIYEAFGKLLSFALQSQLLPILISAIALYMAWQSGRSDDERSAADLVEQRAGRRVAEQQLQESIAGRQMSQEILAELQRQGRLGQQAPPPTQMVAPANRQQRRQAEAEGRRKGTSHPTTRPRT